MEIKILCECGIKFAFDIEPEQGRLPCQVFCPQCNRDNTDQGNAFIANKLSQQAPQAQLKIASSRQEPEHTAQAETVSPPRTHTRVPLPVSDRTSETSSGGMHWTKIVSLAITFIIVISVGMKWIRRISNVAVAVAVAELDDGPIEDNFGFEDAVCIYIKHTDTGIVAKEIASFLQQSQKRKVLITQNQEEYVSNFGAGDWLVYPPHNGYISLQSILETDKKLYLDLARHLSKKYNDTAMIYRDVDFSGEFHFAVYEAGEKKMDAEMKLLGSTLAELEEKLYFSGKEWAIAHGYKEDSEEDDAYKFHWGHANDISKVLGLKLWDLEYDSNVTTLQVDLQ